MKVGILSFSHVHAPGYARCLAAMPDIELVAIADEDEERGAAAVAQFGGTWHADYRDLLARGDVAAVIVTSPNASHREMVVAAAAAGKHVLCEKPLATTRPDALAMIAACRMHSVKLMTAFPMRFSPAALALRAAVQADEAGTPRAVMATNHGKMPPGWFSDPALAGGGAVMDHTVHVADLLRWIFGCEITRVYAEVDTRIHPGIPTDDVALLMMELENGMFASLDPSWARPATWPTWGGLTMDVIGDRGVVAMNAFNQNFQRYDDRAEQYSLLPWSEGGDPAMLRAFFDAIAHDTEPPITGEDGLHALEVALCAYESARRHEPVACPGVLAGAAG